MGLRGGASVADWPPVAQWQTTEAAPGGGASAKVSGRNGPLGAPQSIVGKLRHKATQRRRPIE